jgi:hypothetical protein
MALKFSMKALVVTAMVSGTICAAADTPNSTKIASYITSGLIAPAEQKEIPTFVHKRARAGGHCCH